MPGVHAVDAWWWEPVLVTVLAVAAVVALVLLVRAVVAVARALPGVLERAARGAVSIGFERCAQIGLGTIAVFGLVLSFENLWRWATPTVGPVLAVMFALIVDVLVISASMEAMVCVRKGNFPAARSWRVTAHVGIVGTVFLNVTASERFGDVPLHVVGPVALAWIVELTVRQLTGEWKAEHVEPLNRVPVRLWLVAFLESWRVTVEMARTGVRSHVDARVAVYTRQAAREQLAIVLPGMRARRTRLMILRQMRGRLSPEQVLGVCREVGIKAGATDAEVAARAALALILSSDAPPVIANAVHVQVQVREVEEPRMVRGEPADAPHAAVDAPTRRTAPVARRESARGGSAKSGSADRAPLVDRIAEEMRAVEGWRPDYQALMDATGMSRRWCEGVVSDARKAARGDDDGEPGLRLAVNNS